MAVILNIETSTNVCSVAVTAEGMVLTHFEDDRGQNHAALLSGYIKTCLDYLRDKEMTLDAVAVSIGPGSYTGLRIGLSEAKGLAYALNIPLIGIDTLQIMAVSVMFNHEVDPDALFVPMIDARRMEVYTAVYDMALDAQLAPTPLILDETSYHEWLDKGEKLLFFGNGSDKAKELLEAHPGARFIANIHPLAVDMMALADRAFAQQQFLDLAYSTPAYLKEFQATKPKNLI
ncbi:MAG: tRNA (adenosine(37)-N6)-threonylcarbamoyltransferase complex dimerization subunit type 1 TsaB [Muribaculaceae bacterium]|nr:tRNA (adenosine(37)-N6)-threonylcarbamoyltransferase complex dimerization subunit type 1 TsaB [Muribaculaceae bacterium]